ncbi:branched-chain amino acid aminotransferase [Vespertiliibacter pulmonis]|uniref:4-amino-4-deoxychorismate lyase n=1 Tax=Vespertiliibacter pulmonis TaxID=1443036 RepID=A0A3N4WKE2_9PAST|nr:aminotransferase class IV [Vespertiliibacter pulmonis]QLB20403.1 branched-chain amino acid aminotransferase [Vespertiliibacter pulmonis]RPE86390.1 4-amino-4-deoxychorismate lyase [Vespertiliibacter pulmonis]
MYHYPLFETLAVIDGNIQHIELHQQRIQYSFKYYFKKTCSLFLKDIHIPKEYQSGFFRCRIDYSSEKNSVNFFSYMPRKIAKFHCIETKDLDYQFKYSDRKRLDSLNNYQPDEIIIINNNFISDCTIGNLIFLKKNKWYSPTHYLLKGTQLTYLLLENKIKLVPITKSDLFNYEKIMMINALNPFNEQRAIPINQQTILTNFAK